MSSDGQALRSGIDWKLQLMGDLDKTSAPRVLTGAQLQEWAERRRPGASQFTVRTAADVLAKAGALLKVGTGLYLNRRALPPAEMREAAAFIRTGAVVSLHTGVSGAHNNPSTITHAVLKSTPERRPNVGEVQTSSGFKFHFHSLPARFFPEDESGKRLLFVRAARCPTFTAEASLLQWIHLAKDGRSNLTRPPHGDIEFANEADIADINGLRMSVLQQVAERYGMQSELGEWLVEWRRAHGEEVHEVVSKEVKGSTRRMRT